MRKIFKLIFGLGCCFSIWAGAGEKPLVVTLHPMLAQWVQDLAGDGVEVKNLLPLNASLHTFQPRPRDLAQLQNAVMLVAMGKHLEPYLDRLRENIPAGVKVVEAGERVPSLKFDVHGEMDVDEAVHDHFGIDPHWWQDPMSVRRAVRQLGRELESVFPDEKDVIRKRTSEKMDALAALDRWTVAQLAQVPASERKLVTLHNAFGSFCARYHFEAVPLRSTTHERDPRPEALADTMEIIKKQQVKALFPERRDRGDFLQAVHEASGVPLADPLSADFIPGSDKNDTYQSLFRENVLAIVKALGVSE